ncbi:hypothetical protein EZI45_29985, partial [Delftia tsuruhatensis]
MKGFDPQHAGSVRAYRGAPDCAGAKAESRVPASSPGLRGLRREWGTIFGMHLSSPTPFPHNR